MRERTKLAKKVGSGLLAGAIAVGFIVIMIGGMISWRNSSSDAPFDTAQKSTTQASVASGAAGVAQNSGPVRYLAWTKADRSYITAVGAESFDPSAVYASAGIRFRPAETPAYYSEKATTFEVMRVRSRSLGTLDLASADHVVVHLLGEVHLGNSQLRVARTSCALLTKYEIDAVLLEQPDDLAFETHYSVADPQAAITQMQYAAFELAAAADAGKEIPDYLQEERFRGKTFGQILPMIAAEKGAAEATRVEEILIKASVANELYRTNKYVSSADYLYVMSRLNGLNIPFYGIESRQLRIAFEEKIKAGDRALDTTERDVYMAEKTTALAKQLQLHRVVLICGAAHIPTLQRELERRGAEVHVDYRAPMRAGIKNEMAVLKNPEFVKEIMREPPPPSFHVDRAALVDATPSAQLHDFVQSTLERESGGEATAVKLLQSYTEQGARGKSEWRAESVVDDTTTVVLTRDHNRVELTEERLEPTSLESGWEDVAAGRIVIDEETGQRAGRVNTADELLFVTVEDKNGQYVAYAGVGDPLYAGNDFTSLMAAVGKRMGTRKSLYFDMKNFSTEKTEAFASNCRRNAPEDMSVQFLERVDGKADAQDAIFTAGIRVERAESRVVEEVKEGPRKGWFRVVVDFFVRHAEGLRKVSVEFYARSASTLQEMQTKLATLVTGDSANGALTEMSLAQLVSVMRRDLQARDLYVAATVHDEAKHTLIVTVHGQRVLRAA